MPKREHIPETRDPKPNRARRRHPERELTEDTALTRDVQEGVERDRPDIASIRAKSSGHGKKTADKWNQ